MKTGGFPDRRSDDDPWCANCGHRSSDHRPQIDGTACGAASAKQCYCPSFKPSATTTLRGFTLWRPWSHAVAHLGKRIENRDYPPPVWMVGHHLAIHAGKTYDKAGAYQIRTVLNMDVPDAPQCPQGIVAIACLRGFCASAETDDNYDRPGRTSDWPQDDPWFSGPYGWILDDVVPLIDPVPCRGAQGLWPVPTGIADHLRSVWKVAHTAVGATP